MFPGVHIAGVTNDNIFNTKVGSLSTMLGKQDQVYKAEESALKVRIHSSCKVAKFSDTDLLYCKLSKIEPRYEKTGLQGF